jgi:sugar/nucleoside kinase (ribokinase family)
MVNRGVAAGFMPRLTTSALGAGALLVGTTDPDAQRAALEQWGRRRPTGADTIDHWIEDRPDGVYRVLKAVDIPCVDLDDARVLTGTGTPEAAAAALGAAVDRPVVFKHGEGGSILYMGEATLTVGVYPVSAAIDPTGAGDAYNGALMAALAVHGQRPTIDQLTEAMRYAAATASFAVEAAGTGRLATATPDELEARAQVIQVRRVLPRT